MEIEGYKKSSLPMPDKDQWVVLTHDYNIAWDYYKINLEERGRIYDNFFRTIGIPSVLISTLVFVFPRIAAVFFQKAAGLGADQVHQGSFSEAVASLAASPLFLLAGGLIILVLSFAGFAMFILHCYEEYTSKDYMGFMNSVRNEVSASYPSMVSYLKSQPSERPKLFNKPASYWRVMSMTAINAMLITFGLAFVYVFFEKIKIFGAWYGSDFILFISCITFIIVFYGHVYVHHMLSVHKKP